MHEASKEQEALFFARPASLTGQLDAALYGVAFQGSWL